jgi:glutamate-1-semialdehyde 2,1-aminomutase
LGDGPLCQVLFVEPVRDYRTAFKADREKGRQFMLGHFETGIFLNPMGTKMYLSLAHTDEDLQKVLDISREVLRKIFGLSGTQVSRHSNRTIFCAQETTFRERS